MMQSLSNFIHEETVSRRALDHALAEKNFEGLLEAAPDALIFMDRGGLIAVVNTHAERLFGYNRNEMLGQPVEMLIPVRFRKKHPALRDGYAREPRVRTMGEGRELYGLRKDGTEFPVEISLSPLSTGNEKYVISAVRDVSQRKATEELARVNQERFRLLVDGVRDYAIYLLDNEGKVLIWNSGAQRIKGYTEAEIIGRHFSVFYPPEMVEKKWPAEELRRASLDGRFEDEGWRIRKDGSRFWANVVITALHDANGAPAGFAKVTRDLTDRKKYESDIDQKNAEVEKVSREVRDANRELHAANRELEAFSFSVSHDLRSPLRAVDGFSQELLLQYADKLDDQGRHYLSRIRTGTQRMGQLIDDLLKLSRITRDEMKFERVNLTALAESVNTELQNREPVRNVSFNAKPGLCADCDPRLIRVLLENLLGNAWKFTSKNPSATIAFERTESADKPAFVVRDDGAGFDMTYAAKLFGAFQRLHSDREFPGTGIGLATVQRILRRHGGEIWAEGAVGRGAAFYFTIPGSGGAA